jgi:PIN domain nuclease of toxin-antitoxin system
MLMKPSHKSEIYNLPAIHQDPFDRALIAQATVEELALVSTDAAMGQYASERLRVVQ